MAFILPVRGFVPKFGENCFTAPNSTIVGDFICGDDCSFWFNSVIRADVNSIRLGDKVNVQDNVVIHCTYEKSQTIIGHNVSIGHNAVIHGCEIKDNVLVGMSSVVMDGAVIESGAVIAAGAVILENTHVKANELWGGVPAKKIKDVSRETAQFFIERTANNYVKYASWFQEDQNK